MIQSVVVQEITKAVKDNEEFKNRKRKNEQAKDFLYGRVYNKEFLTLVHSRHEEIKNIPPVEI